MTTELRSSNELANERTELALQRTEMAAGRTLMAWIRTALSLIGFGFTIYKFLQAVTRGAAVGVISPHEPRRIGLFLIALGVISVIVGTLEYYRTIVRLNELSASKFRTFNLGVIMGLFIGLLGLFLFLTILTHTEFI
jgi:putative membrane protein